MQGNLWNKEDVPLVTALVGQHFGTQEAIKKPHIQEYTVKWISSQGVVWLLDHRYIFEEASILTRRKMREWGQMSTDMNINRTKEASNATISITKSSVTKQNRFQDNDKANKVREMFKNQMIEKVKL